MKNMIEGSRTVTTVPEYQDVNFDQLNKIIDDFILAHPTYIEHTVHLRSTIDSYEHYPSNVDVDVDFLRPMPKKELKEQEKRNKVEALAKEKGITPYEASMLINLQERGKV